MGGVPWGRRTGDKDGDGYRLLSSATLCLALSLSFTSTWLLNVVGYPAVDGFCPLGRLVAPLMGALAAAVFSLVSQNYPRLFTSRATVMVTLAVLVASTAGIYLAIPAEDSLLAGVSLSVRWVACVVRDIVLGFAIAGLGSRRCLLVLVCAYLLRYVWAALLGLLPLGMQVAAFFCCAPVGLLVLWWQARPVFVRLEGLDTPANLQVTNPLSFLPSTGRMFVLILLFHAALGFSTTFGSGSSARGSVAAVVALVVLFGLLFALVGMGALRSVDALYTGSYLLATAGFLLVPGLAGEGGFAHFWCNALCESGSSLFSLTIWYLVARVGLLATAGFLLVPGLAGEGGFAHFWCNALCESGSSLFSLTIWYLVARVGARSPAAMLPFVCMVRAARGFGIALGTWGGVFTNALAAGRVESVSVFVAGVVFVFCAYNFLFARRFSFDAAAEGLAPLHEAPSVAEPGEGRAPAIERSCEAVAARCQLTARERDVLLLLARGRNAAYIQEELGLTRSTAKSYVADVYRKLDVHSHQELIDVVEGQA